MEPTPRPRAAVIVAALVVVALQHWVPFGRFVLYPLTLFTTWVHEMGHGVTALLVGGRFVDLSIYGDAGGVAHTLAQPGWRFGLVCVGGLLAPPLVGAVTLAAVRGPRRARLFLGALALAMLVSLVVWVRSPVGFLIVPLVAAALGAAAVWGGPALRLTLAQLLAVVCALDTVTRMVGYAFTDVIAAGSTGGSRSDVSLAADAFGLPRLLVALPVVALALALLAAGLYVAFRAARTPTPRI